MQLIFSDNVSGVDASIQVKPVLNLFVLSKYIIQQHRYYMLRHDFVHNVMSFYV